jgi:hypothetical protein
LSAIGADSSKRRNVTVMLSTRPASLRSPLACVALTLLALTKVPFTKSAPSRCTLAPRRCDPRTVCVSFRPARVLREQRWRPERRWAAYAMGSHENGLIRVRTRGQVHDACKRHVSPHVHVTWVAPNVYVAGDKQRLSGVDLLWKFPVPASREGTRHAVGRRAARRATRQKQPTRSLRTQSVSPP